MQVHTPTELLRTWEAGLAQGDLRARAGVLLALASPELGDAERGSLRVVERDRRLLRLRVCVFGTRFEGLVQCPRCSEALELSFDAADLMPDMSVNAANVSELDVAEWSVRFRLPRADDLEAVAGGRALEEQRAGLMQRLVVGAARAGQACPVTDLPELVLSALEAAMEDANAGILAEIKLNCQVCGHHWSPPFDPAVFLWTELDAWAGRLLWEVHALARAYGWSESELVAMSPWRRQRYLEMLAA